MTFIMVVVFLMHTYVKVSANAEEEQVGHDKGRHDEIRVQVVEVFGAKCLHQLVPRQVGVINLLVLLLLRGFLRLLIEGVHVQPVR